MSPRGIADAIDAQLSELREARSAAIRDTSDPDNDVITRARLRGLAQGLTTAITRLEVLARDARALEVWS